MQNSLMRAGYLLTALIIAGGPTHVAATPLNPLFQERDLLFQKTEAIRTGQHWKFCLSGRGAQQRLPSLDAWASLAPMTAPAVNAALVGRR